VGQPQAELRSETSILITKKRNKMISNTHKVESAFEGSFELKLSLISKLGRSEMESVLDDAFDAAKAALEQVFLDEGNSPYALVYDGCIYIEETDDTSNIRECPREKLSVVSTQSTDEWEEGKTNG